MKPYYLLLENQIHYQSTSIFGISDDVNDFDTLTPNHFLIGEAHSNQSPGEFNSKEMNYPRKWTAYQAASNIVWNCWRKEYLLTLTQQK